ncbi:MAG: tRNA (cytidine(34)-2'-O)-methyltransferase [Clostridiales Family XIII bacterium]|jgi:tRNA (cytidine/uridine-2'-O-)-methyltransferase|nr:tRNA (cytidine(34)-2'-O)-methyltransferase [Clostridiales Family XIII bacterium]
MKAFHIVLIEPEIPPNTGNIARTCAATGTVLHLVEPLGFEVSDRTVKRAGLDYWPFVDMRIHKSFDDFMRAYANCPMYFVTTKGKRLYTEADFEEGAMFLFGKETAGLDETILRENAGRTIRIPMLPNERLRSLNLANSAAIIVYEALRRQGFPGFDTGV